MFWDVIAKIEKDVSGAILRKTSFGYDIHGNQSKVTRWIGDGQSTYTTLYDG